MEPVILAVLVLILGIFIFLSVSTSRIRNELKKTHENATALDLVHQQMESLRDQVNKQLSDVNRQLLDTTGQIGKRLDGASQTIGAVHRGLGELGEASKQIYEIGKDISSLHDILQPPKLRGVLGEVFLKELLSQLVPAACEFQHRFKSGETVDAVIKIGEMMVPVDAKFPLENFRRMLDAPDEQTKAKYRRTFCSDVKKHIDAIALKYILPDEGTYDFALMYIPAENVYYETITKDQHEETSISEYALKRRVIPVSPNTIYAYLQVIIFGLKGLQVEKNAEKIIRHLSRLKGDFAKFSGDFEVLGGHLGNAVKKYEEAGKKLTHFDSKLTLAHSIESDELETEPIKSLPSDNEAEGT